jgi:DNA topoisomerase III
MQLIIAEKPSLGRTIASALGGGKRGDGCLIGDDNKWIVTWAFGHMYQQAMPDDYLPDSVPKTKKGHKVWRREDLPIIPDQWVMHARSDVKKQLKIIDKLLGDAAEVVNAGDPDREGQLLIDEILIQMKWSGSTKRVWLKDLTNEGIVKSFATLKSNQDYAGLFNAAICRARCDWLLGMNITRAFTLAYQKAGGDGVISVGRVQTPTLNLIVERDLTIENFIPKDYYNINATFKHSKGSVDSAWLPKEDDCDPDGQCLKRETAKSVVEKIKGREGKIKSSIIKKKQEPAPLPFSLSGLQTIASSKWGYGAQQVLDAAQKLYEEHKITTYPRTDVGYLANNQHGDAGKIIDSIRKVNPRLVDDVDLKIKSRAFNDKKVTAHTGIIPTAKIPNVSKLSEVEKNLYGIIVRHYVAQFLVDHQYQSMEIKIECQKEKFVSKGRVTLVEGWKTILPPARKEGVELPPVTKGDSVNCSKAKVVDMKTKPPSRFTEGTLIKAMAGIARFVEDPKVKAALKESAGIGTEATRANIIETLKQRNYIKAKGKTLISTDHGRNFIKSVPGRVKDPTVTAWWEQQMSEIAQDGADPKEFMQKMTGWMVTLLNSVGPENFKEAAAANPRKSSGNNPPTKKMMALAKKIAEQRNIKPPRGYTKSFDLTKEFLDHHLGGNR